MHYRSKLFVHENAFERVSSYTLGYTALSFFLVTTITGAIIEQYLSKEVSCDKSTEGK